MEETLKIIANDEAASLTENEKLELFQVEELEDRFELGSWFNSLTINGVCESK